MEGRADEYELVEKISQTKEVVKGLDGKKFVIWSFNTPDEPKRIQNLKEMIQIKVNTIKLIDTWVDNGRYKACVEYFENKDLKHFRRNFPESRYSIEKVLSNCNMLASNINEMHKNYFSHNNIKSKNIFVNSDQNLVLDGFEKVKQEKDHSFKPKINGGIPHALKKTKKELAFIEDIKALAIVFCEVASVKPKKNVHKEVLFEYLQKEFKNASMDQDSFVHLIYQMLTLENYKNTHFIGTEIAKIYKELSETRDIMNIESPIFRLSQRIETKSLNSSRSSVEIGKSHDSDADFSETVSIGSDSKFSPYSQNTESSRKMISEPHTVNDNFHSYQPRGIPNTSESIDHNQIEVESSSLNSLVLIPLNLSQSSNPLDNVILPELIGDEEKNRICVLCCRKTPENFKCTHTYHPDCFKNYIRKYLPSQKMIPPIMCGYSNCLCIIPFDYIMSVKTLDKKIFNSALKQLYSQIKYFCECGSESSLNKLNEDLKFQKFYCTICKSNYCTFCGAKGGHRFSCELLNSLNKNKGIDETIQKFLVIRS